MSSSFEINFRNNILFDEFTEEKPEQISKNKSKAFKELEKIIYHSV